MSAQSQGPAAVWPGVLGELGLLWQRCSRFAFMGSWSVEGLPVCGITFPAGVREGTCVCCQPVCRGARPGSELWLSPGGWLMATGLGPGLTGAGGHGRHYLGDRLLAQGPSWLEGGIVEQIGLCFPSRFPQDMLSNLAESEELQRQFCLFQLQEQDKRLLELDTGLDEVRGIGVGRPGAAGFPGRIPEPDWSCPRAPVPRCWEQPRWQRCQR